MINDSLFLVIPNNSGSTFLSKCLSNCKKVSYLPKEGQFIEGFKGVVPSDYNAELIWSATEVIDKMDQPQYYDWDANKLAWFKHIQNFQPNHLFVEKSPPNVGRVKMLADNFYNSKFIISVRNPYAVVESILRARINKPVELKTIVKHVVIMMHIQRNNIALLEQSGNRYVNITYEDMCDNPLDTEDKIISLSPMHLHDLTFFNEIMVKKRYNSIVKNYNAAQISRLSESQKSEITRMLKPNKEILDYFGYTLL